MTLGWLLLVGCEPISSREAELSPPVLDMPDQLVMGTDVVCTRTGTRISCLRLEPYSFGWEAPPGEYVEVAGGGGELCGILTTGEVQCWYDGNSFSAPTPGPFITLGLGSHRSCGVRPDGGMECWSDASIQAPCSRSGPYTRAAGASYATCGLTPSGTIDCWDAWSHDTEPPTTPGWVWMEGYGAWVCALNTEGEVACWGTLRGGRLPERVPTGSGYRDVSVSVEVACALDATGEVECFGQEDVDAGVLSPPKGPFTQIAGGNRSACGLRPNGVISCWGCLADESCPADLGVVRGELVRL